jgi:hypothetical protein
MFILVVKEQGLPHVTELRSGGTLCLSTLTAALSSHKSGFLRARESTY